LGHNPVRLSENVWDDGYPSGGNYWDDYLTRYPDAKEIDGSGIGDTPYFIYQKNQDNYPLLPYWFPPTISIVSPENKTYAVANVHLNFTVSEAAPWMGYSLDGQMNMTVSGNTTLVGLSDDVHTITVYANDTVGNMGSSDTIYFTVDTVAPNIELLSPENKTYAVANVHLNFTVSEATSWIRYSLDGQANNTITGNTILIGLSDGTHSLVVYASDMLGNTGASDTVYFTVDTTLPIITILSPENKTYDTSYVQLVFTVDEAVSWMAYRLDGQANATITENVTLTPSDGLHYVVVYANDTAGNMRASDPVYFTVDTKAPIIMILSPKNETYASTSLSLNFTQSEPTSWIGCSLDGQTNVTVGGNTTLVGLSEGVHTITVYANDTVGNMGSSGTVYFTIDTVLPNIELLSPENKTYAVADVPLSFIVSEAPSWRGYSLDGQTNETVSGNTTLVGLSDRVHTITVYAADTAGNTGHSNTIYFTVDTTLPSITILSPENKTYDTAAIPVSFTVDKAVSWMGYSLDGQANVTITGDTTLASLVDGVHYIVVYANNTAGKMGASNTVYFTVDTKAPIIIIFSPENKTYGVNNVSLTFTVTETQLWMGYSLDGQANITVIGNTTLLGLSDGIQTITVYGTDIAGNTGSSDIVYFTVDTVSVSIDLLSPENKTYTTDSVSLSFAVDEETSWIGYSLDGQANNTITGDTTLTGLSDGTHSLVVYASDMLGNTGSSDTVYFTIDTARPNIELLSPENKTYAVADVPLSFTVSEATSWMGYSLDGQMNVTVRGNITFVGLSDDVHTITVYANDADGNMGRSGTVYFTVNALPPNIELFSPENKTYTTNSVSLSFAVNEPTLWRGYSLDGQANVTIFGDITLAGLSEGSHSLVVYVKDMDGNTGASGIVYFAVENRQTEPSQLWVVAVIAIVAGVGFALSGYMAYDLFKRAQK